MKKRWVALLFLSVVFLWFLCFWLLNGAAWAGVPYTLPESYVLIGDRGTFGDMFGSVNALFSGLAFAGLICTLIVQMNSLNAQREELSLTREELTLTRGELAGQREALLEQGNQMAHQRLDNSFFQLLNRHQEIIAGLTWPRAEGVNGAGVMHYVSDFISKEALATEEKLEEEAFDALAEQHAISGFTGVIDQVFHDSQYPLDGLFTSIIMLYSHVDSFDEGLRQPYYKLVDALIGVNEMTAVCGEILRLHVDLGDNRLETIIYKRGILFNGERFNANLPYFVGDLLMERQEELAKRSKNEAQS